MNDFTKCKKEICKKEFEKINKNKKLIIEKKRLEKKKDFNDIDKIINNIYSNIDQKEYNLCLYKKCEVYNKILQDRINILKNNIKEHNIKLSPEFQNKFDNLLKLFNKKSLTDEEYIKSIILYQFIKKLINIKVDEHIKEVFNVAGIFQKCSNNNCKKSQKEVFDDKELRKKKLSIILMKDDEKRNKIIRDIYSNEKHIKLDKCNVKNCNNEYLNLLKEVIEIYNKKIKTQNINIPEININKINENDIPEFIIKFNQFINHIDYSK